MLIIDIAEKMPISMLLNIYSAICKKDNKQLIIYKTEPLFNKQIKCFHKYSKQPIF